MGQLPFAVSPPRAIKSFITTRLFPILVHVKESLRMELRDNYILLYSFSPGKGGSGTSVVPVPENEVYFCTLLLTLVTYVSISSWGESLLN